MEGGHHGADAPAYGIAPPDHRLPPRTRLGRVRLQVADLDRSLEYYERVLGLGVRERSAGHAALGAAPDGPHLLELHERAGAAAVPRGGHLGLYHYALLLPDRASLGRLLAHVTHITEPGARPAASDHLVSEALYLRDPDGLQIEVYADRPRAAWQTRDRQLVMATEPLDLPSLLQAAGEAPWTGMPAGTTVGHVHLHVGDLERAEAFYHRALGLDKVVWSYPGALFLSAGGYHHHLGVNTWARQARPAAEDEARLLEWEMLVPTAEAARRALDSLDGAGHAVEPTEGGGIVRDPWGTAVRIVGDF